MYTQKRIFLINLLLVLLLCLFLIVTGMGSAATRNSDSSTYDNTGVERISPDFDEDYAFFLVNGDYPLQKDYAFERAVVQGDFELDARCADLAIEMLEDAKKANIELSVCSAYRSSERQSELQQNYINRMQESGYTLKEAETITAMQIAAPGESEHNSGLAMDIVSVDWFQKHDDLTEDFQYTREYYWLAKNSWKYGFILRYPKGKSDVTGIIYEPWHYRFVGRQKAEQIYCSGMTLEEYIEYVSTM